MRTFLASSLVLLALCSLCSGRTLLAAEFTRDIQPILAKHCVSCHGPDKQRGSLRLDSGAALRQGGNSGPVVVPGKSAGSLLIKAVTGSDDAKVMPPKGDRLAARD